MLAALLQRRPIEECVAIVVAHPDDETIAAGGSMHLMRRLLLVHVTDGAPRNLGDAAREGFSGPAEYAAARLRELDAAMALSGADSVRASLGIADQDATCQITGIASSLRELFRQHHVEHALTHAYEGGHPDHDAVAKAVHLAAGHVFEFAGYHAGADGSLSTGKFVAPTARDVEVVLDTEDRRRKSAMLACFHTQRDILGHFDGSVERFRAAPEYDFTEPPHAGRLLYEEWGWMTGAAWRQAARCGV